MTEAEARALERGMALVQRLPEIHEEADPRIQSVFDDLRSTLRVPVVNYLFRSLASYPAFLEAAWFHVRPHLRTRALEREADLLREMVSLDLPADGAEMRAAVGDKRETLCSFTDTLHYVLPKLLLIASALDGCLPRFDADEPLPPQEGLHAATGLLPLGVAAGTVSLPLVSPTAAPEDVRGLFEEIKRYHHHPGVATFYRALGNWPQVLSAAWARVKPFIDSPAYLELREQLIQRAESVVRGWIQPFDAEELQELELNAQAAEDVRALLTVYRLRIIPDLLLDVSLVHALLEGPDAARQSRFSNTGAGAREESAEQAPA